jgi:hypothetical protein
VILLLHSIAFLHFYSTFTHFDLAVTGYGLWLLASTVNFNNNNNTNNNNNNKTSIIVVVVRLKEEEGSNVGYHITSNFTAYTAYISTARLVKSTRPEWGANVEVLG